jgi:membrane-associated protease RseP (regulator of RpoE activity)
MNISVSEEKEEEIEISEQQKAEEELKKAEEKKKKEEEEKKTVSFQVPFILVKTRRGVSVMDRIAAWKTTDPLGKIAVYLFPFIGAIGFSLIIFSASVMLTNAPVREFVRGTSPLIHILLPGLNPFIPVIYGWLALIVAMVVHEGSHGILARSFKLRIKSSGLIFFLILPIGAFVDIDEEELKKTSARKTTRVMASGPMSNLAVGFASLFCLMLVVGSMNPVANGVGVVGVYQDFPADDVGIDPSDIILSINGNPISKGEEIRDLFSTMQPGDTVNVKFLHDGQEMERSLTLAADENSTRAIMGIQGFDAEMISGLLDDYRTPTLTSPLLYLFIPTFTRAQERVPFSDLMNQFYTSPLGSATFLVANILFWMWFVNFNLAIFNALPLYPLDGGQALRASLEAYGAKRGWGEKTAKRIVTVTSLTIVGILISVIAGPYFFI